MLSLGAPSELMTTPAFLKLTEDGLKVISKKDLEFES